MTFDGAAAVVEEAEETTTGEITDEAAEAIKALADADDLTPTRVVEEAEDEESPLHRFFEWDDSKAAHAHRLNQARALIRRVRVEVTIREHTFKVPAYLHDPDRDKGGGYLPTARVAGERDTARRVLAQELGRAYSALDRAKRVAVALGMVEAVTKIAEEVTALRAQVDDEE